MGVARQIVNVSKATINSLENRLAGVLKPVPPRKEFVNTLGSQIQTIQHQPTLVHHVANEHIVLLLLAGILSAGALLLLGIRSIVSLVNTHRKVLRRA